MTRNEGVKKVRGEKAKDGVRDNAKAMDLSCPWWGPDESSSQQSPSVKDFS